MRVFVTGGTGFVGGYVRRALLDAGHKVRILVHHRGEGLEPEVEQVLGDVTEGESFKSAVTGCDATINLVGIIREFPERGITYQRLVVEGTRNVLAAAKGAGVRRHLQMSALGTRRDAPSGYFRAKYSAETLVQDAGLDYTIFRPSVIFGPNDDFVNKLAGYLKLFPVMPVIGDGEYELQPIAVEDVARSFALALEMPQTIGRTYELCGPERMTYNRLLDAIGRGVGKGSVKKAKSPLFLVRLVVPFLERFPSFPLTSDQLTMLIEGTVCDGSWKSTFDFEPTPFEAGIARYLKG